MSKDIDGAGPAEALVGRTVEVAVLLLFFWLPVLAATTIFVATGDERLASQQIRQWWDAVRC